MINVVRLCSGTRTVSLGVSQKNNKHPLYTSKTSLVDPKKLCHVHFPLTIFM